MAALRVLHPLTPHNMWWYRAATVLHIVVMPLLRSCLGLRGGAQDRKPCTVRTVTIRTFESLTPAMLRRVSVVGGKCHFCGQRFTTMEQVQAAALLVAKHDGRREPFSRDKVHAGVMLACAKRPVSVEDVDGLVVAVEREVERLGRAEVPSALIGELVMEQLRALDWVAYVRFASIYRTSRTSTDLHWRSSRCAKPRPFPPPVAQRCRPSCPSPSTGGFCGEKTVEEPGPSRKTGGGGGSHTGTLRAKNPEHVNKESSW